MVMKRTCSLASSRNAPVKYVVTVSAPGFSTPRSDMYICSASIITATPRGLRISSIAVALVKFFIGADHAPGRLEQAFAVGIVAGIGDQRAHGGFRLLARRARLDRHGRRPHMLGQALLGPRLYDGVLGVHNGLSVRPARTHQGCTGSVTGVAASVTRLTALVQCGAPGRRILNW